MPLTPATLPRHELIGLTVRVAAASNPDLVGIEGEVVMETTRTLTIESREASPDADGRTESGEGERVRPARNGVPRADRAGRAREKTVPKAGATFEFELPAETDADEAAVVTVEGDRLVARPARRTERTGDSKWR